MTLIQINSIFQSSYFQHYWNIEYSLLEYAVFQNLQYIFQDKRDTKNIILAAIVFWERALDCVFDSFYDVQKGRKIILKRRAGWHSAWSICGYTARMILRSANSFPLRISCGSIKPSALPRYSNFPDTRNLWIPRYSRDAKILNMRDGGI